MVQKLVQADVDNGIIIPLKANVFDASDIENAYRFMSTGQHIGKVLLKLRDNANDTQTVPISVVPRLHCHQDKSSILVGGLGGFGLELADWLVLRGCRKLVLSSTRGVKEPYQETRIK